MVQTSPSSHRPATGLVTHPCPGSQVATVQGLSSWSHPSPQALGLQPGCTDSTHSLSGPQPVVMQMFSLWGQCSSSMQQSLKSKVTSHWWVNGLQESVAHAPVSGQSPASSQHPLMVGNVHLLFWQVLSVHGLLSSQMLFCGVQQPITGVCMQDELPTHCPSVQGFSSSQSSFEVQKHSVGTRLHDPVSVSQLPSIQGMPLTQSSWLLQQSSSAR